MKNINDALKEYGIHDISDWCEAEYNKYFSQFFANQEDLYKKFSSGYYKITDEELECVLTDIPLDLFKVSEVLNDYRLSVEVIKLRIKEKEKCILYSEEYFDKSEAARKATAELATIEDKIILNAFNCVITRVENQISFSREFIMGAKKIWDSRQKGENANPINPVDPSSNKEKIAQYYVK